MHLWRSKHHLDWHRNKEHCTSWSKSLSGQPSSCVHQQRKLFWDCSSTKAATGISPTLFRSLRAGTTGREAISLSTWTCACKRFRLPPAAPLHLIFPLPWCSRFAPSLLPLKRPCSLYRSKTAISNRRPDYIRCIYTDLQFPRNEFNT